MSGAIGVLLKRPPESGQLRLHNLSSARQTPCWLTVTSRRGCEGNR